LFLLKLFIIDLFSLICVHVCYGYDMQEARTNYRNFRDLLWNLIFKKHWNDLEKARYVHIEAAQVNIGRVPCGSAD